MTYSAGGLIEAADYNNFAGQVNNFWSTGSGDQGWGQTAISAVSLGGVVTATNWATLVNNISTAGAQTATAITARSAPTTGTLISILSSLQTDITNISTNRGNAASSGGEVGYASGTTAKTSATSNGNRRGYRASQPTTASAAARR